MKSSFDLSKSLNQALRAAGLLPPESVPAQNTGASPPHWPKAEARPTRPIALSDLEPLTRQAGLMGFVLPGARGPAGWNPASPGSTPEQAPSAVPGDAAGETLSRTCTAPAGTRSYRLYVPARAAEGPMPLLVMLHGCKQDPDDFAAGTRMNRLAEEHGFLVAYPAQAARANGSNCWNWFQTQDQQRDEGEPSIIAAIVQEVRSTHDVDAGRVFIAGLSAGAAMALITGSAYPDVFAGVGAHSGLPLGAAHDVASAFAAMRAAGSSRASATRLSASTVPPTIVFHGDQDHTVAVANGNAIVAQALEYGVPGLASTTTSERASSTTRAFTKTVHATVDGRPRVEQWVLGGAGHAWSGGSRSGSFTDELGPDASAEMVRFFLAQAS